MMGIPTIIWIAMATLHKLNPRRSSFTTKEIRDTVIEQGLRPDIAITTLNVYLTSYAVATTPVLVDNCRYLLKIARGVYRLWADGDDYNTTRQHGRMYPSQEMLGEFATLLPWYFNEYVPKRATYEQPYQGPSLLNTNTSISSPLIVKDHINVVDEVSNDILKFSVSYNDKSGEMSNKLQLNIKNQQEREAALIQIKALLKIVAEPT